MASWPYILVLGLSVTSRAVFLFAAVLCSRHTRLHCECAYGKSVYQVEEQGVPSLSEAEEAYLAEPGGSADISHLQAERQRTRMRLSSIARLEQVGSPPS